MSFCLGLEWMEGISSGRLSWRQQRALEIWRESAIDRMECELQLFDCGQFVMSKLITEITKLGEQVREQNQQLANILAYYNSCHEQRPTLSSSLSAKTSCHLQSQMPSEQSQDERFPLVAKYVNNTTNPNLRNRGLLKTKSKTRKNNQSSMKSTTMPKYHKDRQPSLPRCESCRKISTPRKKDVLSMTKQISVGRSGVRGTLSWSIKASHTQRPKAKLKL